jgi:hypothetical protein
MASRYNKYNAKKTTIDNIVFDSKLESARYKQLKLLEQAGEIRNLRLQIKIPLEVNDRIVCSYICDFLYIEKNKLVIEDVKGVQTDVFKIKWKLLQALYSDLYDVFRIWPEKKKGKNK